MRKLLFLVLFCGIFFHASYAQSKDKTIAKIGNISITGAEYKARYELTPLPGMHQKKTGEAIKERFLYTLIGEKLLALGALEDRLDTNDIVKYTLETFEKMFVRDALFKQVVTEAAGASANSLLSVYISEASEFHVLYMEAEDSSHAYGIYKLLLKGTPFELKDTLKIKIGTLDESAETILTKLPENSSAPLYLNGKWIVCKMLKRINPVLARITGWEADYKNLKRAAAERAGSVYYNRFMNNFFKGKAVNANGVILKSLAAKISAILTEKQKVQADKDKFLLDIPDLLTIENQYRADSLGMPVILLEGKSISLKEYLRHFRFESFVTNKTDYQSVGALLNSKTKEYIEEELLAAEGYKRGLQNSDYVKESYLMWRDNYLSKVQRAAITDTITVSDNEINAEMNKPGNNTPETQLKLVEIIIDSLETVERILNELKNNNDILIVAKKYSKKPVPDELSFQPASAYGEAGRIALDMNAGELYGPLKTNDGYMVVKLIAKKETPIESEAAGRSKELIKNTLAYEKSTGAVNRRIALLANKYGIDVNKVILDEVQPANITSLVFRYLGFGGRITAVPFIAPDDDWVKQWRESSNIQ